jgi:hypothetical protein
VVPRLITITIEFKSINPETFLTSISSVLGRSTGKFRENIKICKALISDLLNYFYRENPVATL